MLDRLTLDQLRVLISVADSGNFSTAGRRLGRAQSAISQSIRSLETTLRVDLFDRGGKVAKLTPAGHLLIEHARQLVDSAQRLRDLASGFASDTELKLTVAIDPMVPQCALIGSLEVVATAFPGLSITIYTEGRHGSERKLRAGQAQIAIYAPSMATGVAGLAATALTTIPLAPVVAAGHPLVGEPSPLTRAQLEQYIQLDLTDSDEATPPLPGSLMSNRMWRFTSLGTRLGCLLGGLGWGHMPVHLIKEHLQSGRLVQLVIGGHRQHFLHADLYIVHEPGRPPGPAGSVLIKELARRLDRTG